MEIKEIGDVISKIKDAELVLVGLGEALDLTGKLEREEGCMGSMEDGQLIPFIRKISLDERKMQKSEVYEDLAKCLMDKNYFIVSLCQDGLIKNSGLNQEHIVEPCGSYDRLQCSENCSNELYGVPEDFLGQLKEVLLDGKRDVRVEIPKCPHCGKPLVFNNVEAENYVEEGYLEQWGIYKKWLQGTVNKRLCILELGVGMKYPTVIRWPFEKIAFFNQKAELIRVHSRLYQIAEEIKERGLGICQSPEVFLKELSNGF